MPEIGVNCQDQKRIMHSTGIEKNGNSTEKIIGGKEAMPEYAFADNRAEKADLAVQQY